MFAPTADKASAWLDIYYWGRKPMMDKVANGPFEPSEIGALPPAIDAPYSMREANQGISLFSGPMSFQGQSETVDGEGEISVEWLPSPRVNFRLNSKSGWHDFGSGTILVSELGRANSAHVTRFQLSSDSECRITGCLDDEVRHATRVHRMVAHLCNFPSYIGKTVSLRDSWVKGRLLVSDDVWAICIDPSADCKECSESASGSAGYAITHVCEIRRNDGGDFFLPGPLDPLFRFLSFAAGRWCGLCLPVGYDRLGNRVGELWSIQKVTPHGGQSTWFPLHNPRPFADVYPRFSELWRSTEGQRTLKLGIGWYVHAVGIGELEARLIQATAGLELLAYFGLAHWPSSPTVSDAAFGNLPLDEQIRRLLALCHIPPDVPSQLIELKALMAIPAGWKHGDGPELLSWVRNSVIHPVVRLPLTSAIMWEALELALYYMELSILRFLDYRGPFMNRIGLLGGTVWQGQYGPVPWV